MAALTDFGEGRAEVWGNADPRRLVVHELGDTWADVTEGSPQGIWQRYRYDWSKPGLVRLDVLDSNAFGRGSFWEYRVAPDERGGSTITLNIRRNPTTLKGRLFDLLLAAIGPTYFRRDLRRTISVLEARERGEPAAG